MASVPPTSPAPYQPKHWHLPIWIAVFVAAVFIGGATFLLLRNSSAKDTQIVDTTSAQNSSVPIQIGDCVQTTVADIGYRLSGVPDDVAKDSGSSINYTDGLYQVSYETVSGIVDSKIGDTVHLCLVSLPVDCPAGDDQGKVYKATNLRTGESWQEADSEHECGGA